LSEEKPKFVHYEKYRKGVDELFRVWKAASSAIREILSLVPITEGVSWAIQGEPGTGKSVFIKTLAKVFYGGNYANVKFDESQMPDDVFYYLGLPKLITKGVEEVHPRPFMKAWLKWANEMMTRANRTVKNTCLGMLAEREVTYKDTKLKASPGIFIDDYNRYLIGALDEAGWAFVDRHDVNVNIPMTGFREDVELILLKYGKRRHARDISTLAKPILSEDETREICDDVKRVDVPDEIAIWATMLFQAFKVCKFERSVKAPAFRIECSECEFNGEPCANIKACLSTRAVDSIISLAKARAWSHKRDRINMSDVMFVLPYVMNHRLHLKPEVAVNYLNEEEYARTTVKSLLERKRRIWKEAAQNFVTVVQEDLAKAAKALDWLADYGKKDLVVKHLGDWAEEEFGKRSVEATKKLEEAVKGFETEVYTLGMIDEALTIVKHLPKMKKLKERLEKLKENLTFKVDIEKKVYYEKVVPFMSTVDKEAATKMAEPFEGTRTVEVETDNVKVEERATETKHSLTITFKKSEDADKFRGLL